MGRRELQDMILPTFETAIALGGARSVMNSYAEVDGVPAGTAAWRTLGGGRAEMKRVYVEQAFRRRGLAQVVVAALEESARRAGYRSVVLNSGDRQPEALALYEALGYTPVPGYGIYAEGAGAVFLGRELGGEEEERPWAS
jgi:GNAT superfamily N-acetyltransferase